MFECIICFENKKKTLNCVSCSKTTCKKCLKKYKKYECCNCNQKFLEKNIKDIFGDEIIEKYVYYYVYQKFFLNIKIQDTINKHFAKLENQKNLRFGFIKNNLEKEVIKRCFDKNCKGVFYDENCSLCSNKICITCEEPEHKNVDCDQKVLENLKEIKNDCKKCPFCYIYIHKTEGCNSMKCTNCGVSFNWRNLEIDNKKNNTEHYQTILNKNLNQYFLTHFKNNRFVKEIDTEEEKTHHSTFSFLKNKKFLCENYKSEFVNLYKNLKKKEKTLKKYEIEYLLKIEDLLKENIDNDLDLCFDSIDFKICKKLYTEDKAYNFMYFVLDNIQQKFVNKTPFNIDDVKELIEQYNNDNILFKNSSYIFKNNKIVLNKPIKQKIKTFTLFKKEKYENNGKITLLDDEQIEHARNVFKNLIKYNSCLNSSYAGSGKTYVSLYVARKLEVKNLILVVPNIMVTKWKELIEYYNYKNKFNYLILNFNELYTKSFEENNNLFQKLYTSQTKNEIRFTDYLLDFIDDNTMFIIDEIHNSKSSSTTSTKFIQELAKTVKKQNGYVLGISATPLEKHTEIEHILKKIHAIKEFKPLELNKYKNCLHYKTSLVSLYTILNANQPPINNKTNNEEEDESLSNNEEEDESLSDNEEEDESLSDNESLSDDDNKASTSGLQKNIEKTITYEKFKKLEKIRDSIVFKTPDMKKYFTNIFQIKPVLKYKTKIEKITNLLKNLIIIFGVTPTEIFEQAKVITRSSPFIYYETENNKSKNYEYNPIQKEYCDLKKYYGERKSAEILNRDTFLNIKGPYLKFFKTNEKIFKDKKFEEEYKRSNDQQFKNKINSYFLKVAEESMYFDLSTIKYIEEIGFKLYYILFHNKPSYYSQNLIDVLTLFYLFDFNIYQCYYFSLFYLDDIIKIFLKILLKKINYNIKTDQLKKITYFKNLSYLNFNLSQEDKKTLDYAFTNIDIKTDKKINNSSLYFISLISKGLEQTETVYIKYLLNLVDIFYSLKKFKIILAVSFTNTIDDLKVKLIEDKRNFLIINGQVKNKNKVIKQFNEDEDQNLLIVNIKSLNCGIDLDDKIGTKPRLVFIVPNFSFTTLIQFIFRFKRKDTASEPYVYIVNNHNIILSNLINKYKNMHNLNFDTPFIKQIKTKNDNEIIEELL